LYYNNLPGHDAELWSTDPHPWHFLFLFGCNSSADLVLFDLVLPLVVIFGGSLGFVGSAGALLDGPAVGTLLDGLAAGFFFLDLFKCNIPVAVAQMCLLTIVVASSVALATRESLENVMFMLA
jgi:hypothetical protein